MTSDLRFTMHKIIAVVAVLTLTGAGIGVGPSSAAEECHQNSCATTSVARTDSGWKVHFTIRMRKDLGYEFFNLQMPGHAQREIDGPGNHVELDLEMPAGWNGTYAVQACMIGNLRSICDPWSTFQAELPIASDDRKFCNFYAGLASAAAAVAQEQNCGFDSSSGRWSTDNESHFNWCLGQFQAAAGVADRLAAARNLANSEEAARNTGVQQCQASAAASQAQLEYDIQVTGKTAAQCQGSHDNCVARARGLGSLNSPAAIASCAPILQACMSNAAAAQKAYTDQRSYEIQVTGKSAGECQSTYQSCEARVRATYGPVNAPVQIAAECAPSLPVCLANAAAALAAAAPGDATPAPGQEGQPPAPPAPGGGGLTASTCGLSGTATVVIPDPALTTLNVRDKPNGNILSKIPENAQVEVMGPCGVQLSAGIVAQKPGQVIPGWCAISTPQVTGCVSEQFLVAGIPAGGPLGAGSAGIVANPSQTAPQPQPQIGALPPVVVTTTPTGGGGQIARLIKGANIRNAASGGDRAKTGSSLPGGTIVTVLECVPSWCRIALPQFPVAWVSRDFLAFDVAGAPAPGASIDVTINIGGGGAAPAPAQPPAPPAPGGGGLTASTCGLSGTATVVIPDPALTTLNVRDKPNGNILSKIPENAQVEVMGPCGVQLSAGIVAQKPGQVIPGWCAISTPQVTGCVSEQFLVAGIPAGGPLGAGSAGIVATEPQSAAAPTFTGTWNAEAQGSGYTFMLNQDGNTVAGSYRGGDGSNGQLNGSVSGNVLRFAWQQTDGVSGAGKFTLSGDGNSFNGSYTLSSDPDVAEGSWNGTRQ